MADESNPISVHGGKPSSVSYSNISLTVASALVMCFFVFLFPATAVAAAANPHHSIPVGTAHLVAQACAFRSARPTASSPAAYATCCQPRQLPGAGQDGQVS